MSLGLNGKQILVTGASGFIGARLIECLTSAYGAQVHALIRRFGTSGAARVARLANVRMFYGDICDTGALRRASDGCRYIIHCATGTMGSEKAQRAATVDGTRYVMEAAQRVTAARVVYFSSASVHGPARDGTLDEARPLRGDFPYARMKIEAERIAVDCYRRHGLPVVILRPTCVWGPYSPNWTVAAVELIRAGSAFLPRQGQGAANVVYIDHLVDAVCLALIRAEAVGQSFLINDDEPTTWGQLYGGYAKHLATELRYVRDEPSRGRLLQVSWQNACTVLRHALTGQTRVGIRTLREFYTHVPLAKYLAFGMPEGLKEHIKRYVGDRELVLEAAAPPPKRAASDFLAYDVLPKPTRELYGSSGRYANDKAKRLLGWRPRLPFAETMARTCQWLSYAGYAR